MQEDITRVRDSPAEYRDHAQSSTGTLDDDLTAEHSSQLPEQCTTMPGNHPTRPGRHLAYELVIKRIRIIADRRQHATDRRYSGSRVKTGPAMRVEVFLHRNPGRDYTVVDGTGLRYQPPEFFTGCTGSQ